jgi:peptidoglycan hydrolase CwlO-like protein
MTSQYNRLLYDNYCLQYHCSQLTTRISVLELKIQTLESKIQTLELKIQTMESNIHAITENISNNPPIYSRKSRNKHATFSMNQYNPIVLPQTILKTHIKTPIITHEPEQYSSLTEDSDT